jgi:hypothetical protein
MGRTSANLGDSKPLFACVDRTFGNPFIAPARAIFSARSRELAPISGPVRSIKLNVSWFRAACPMGFNRSHPYRFNLCRRNEVSDERPRVRHVLAAEHTESEHFRRS